MAAQNGVFPSGFTVFLNKKTAIEDLAAEGSRIKKVCFSPGVFLKGKPLCKKTIIVVSLVSKVFFWPGDVTKKANLVKMLGSAPLRDYVKPSLAPIAHFGASFLAVFFLAFFFGCFFYH